MNVRQETRGRFRPSIVIFIDDPAGMIAGTQPQVSGGQAGQKSVYEYFLEQMASLNSELQAGIGLLVCQEGSYDTNTRSPGTQTQTAPLHFSQALRNTLSKVQSSRLKRNIETIGYSMFNAYPQIYLVARAQSSWMTSIVEQLMVTLGPERANMFLAYMLVDTPAAAPVLAPANTSAPGAGAIAPAPPLWVWDLLIRSSEMQPRVDYCLLYEQREGYDYTYVEDADLSFAVAEALLALTGTDFSFSPLFNEHTQLPVGGGNNIEDRIGSLGTSRIVFPYVEIEQYCSNTLGAELMECQLRKLKQVGGDEKRLRDLRKQMRERVYAEVEIIEEKLGDNQPRPSCPEHFWPALHFLGNEQLQQQLQIATENVFQHFDPERQMQLLRRQQLANLGFRRWQAVTVQALGAAAEELQREIEQNVHDLLEKDDTGLLASLYAERFDDLLNYLRDQFMDLRIKHKQVHDEEIEQLRMASIGPWEIITQSSALLQTGQTQAGPPTAGPHYAGNLVGGSPPPGGSGPNNPLPAPTSGSTPAGRVDRMLSESLQQRIPWLETRVPGVLHMCSAGLLVLPPILLLLYDAFNLSWPAQAGSILSITGGLIAFFVVLCLFLRYLALRNVHKAEEDLFNLYRYHLAYRCEQWEDRRRIVLLGSLVSFIRQMRVRLENMISFTTTIKEAFEKEAERVERELFTGPSAYRDVLVGDGCLLDSGGNSLAVLNDRIREFRLASPREDWHQSNELVNTYMQRQFFERGISMIRVRDEQEMFEKVRDFCIQVLQPYFREEVADLSFVLGPLNPQGELAWKHLLKYSTVLYLPHTRPVDYLYVGGAREYHNKLTTLASAPDAQLLIGFSKEWFMALHFWPGGSTSHWTNFSVNPVNPGALPNIIPQTPSW